VGRQDAGHADAVRVWAQGGVRARGQAGSRVHMRGARVAGTEARWAADALQVRAFAVGGHRRRMRRHWQQWHVALPSCAQAPASGSAGLLLAGGAHAWVAAWQSCRLAVPTHSQQAVTSRVQEWPLLTLAHLWTRELVSHTRGPLGHWGPLGGSGGRPPARAGGRGAHDLSRARRVGRALNRARRALAFLRTATSDGGQKFGGNIASARLLQRCRPPGRRCRRPCPAPSL
jgi:hypothetical protein